jgi:IclR family mhp operon transcriptional activator
MPRSETIQGLERGLRVVKALHETPIASLHEMHLATRISKPSLLRILRTLEQAGLVSQRLADGHYRLSGNLGRISRRRDRYDRIAEAAAPVLDRLCQKIKWPSDLFVPSGVCMERRETSRPRSPFVFPNSSAMGVGERVG